MIPYQGNANILTLIGIGERKLINNQPITRQKIDTINELKINEIFYSIQGEGPWQGEPVLFIRLAGCNLRCTYCDTKYHTELELTPREILDNAQQIEIPYHIEIRRVVITGGEPFVQNIIPLVDLFWDQGYSIQIETNGTLSIPEFPYSKTLLVCSPKTHKIHDDIIYNCYHWKYVVSKDDVLFPNTPTQDKGKRPPFVVECRPMDVIWIMPQDDDTGENKKAALEICLKHGFRYAIRLHKILGVR